MRNSPLYKRLKQIAINGDYTVEQLRNATNKQICNLVDKQNLKSVFIANVKILLSAELQDRNDEANMRALGSSVHTWLNANFPDFKIERGKEDGKPYVKIWLRRKSESVQTMEVAE